MKNKKYTPTKCECCGQTTDYEIKVDKGTATIVLAVYNAVRRLDRNQVHLTKDMEARAEDFESYQHMVSEGFMTSNMADNVLRAKYHGLVAQVEGGGRGEYLITRKGAEFLRGKAIPRTAIVDKVSHSKKTYLDLDDTITFSTAMRDAPWWDLNETAMAKVLGYSEHESENGTLGI